MTHDDTDDNDTNGTNDANDANESGLTDAELADLVGEGIDDDGDLERVDRAQIGADTLAIVNAGFYVAPSGARVDVSAATASAIAGTRVVLDAAVVLANARAHARGDQEVRVEVTGERTGECARRLVGEGHKRVALLNFANGVRVGGGFLHGAAAQEEDLCRCSALYPCLSSKSAQAFYVENTCNGTALVSDALIVSPGVPFFRDDTSPTLALIEQPFVATVITGAAPDRGWLAAQLDSALIKRVEDVDDAHITAAFERRARAVIACAHDDGADALVLGAWGCGAFGNEPERVAAAFKKALAELGACVPRVVFAVWQRGGKNHTVFERVLRR